MGGAQGEAGVTRQCQDDQLPTVRLGHEGPRRGGHDVGKSGPLIRGGIGLGVAAGDRVRLL